MTENTNKKEEKKNKAINTDNSTQLIYWETEIWKLKQDVFNVNNFFT